MTDIFYSPFFGITLSIAAFQAGILINQKTKLSLLNPYLLSVFICMLFLKIFQIPLEAYRKGGDIVGAMLPFATTMLAVSAYRQMHLIKKYLFPILAGCLIGALTSWFSVKLLCNLFGISDQLTISSLLPKSSSTPFAMLISEKIGGDPSLAAAAVAVTGIFGGVFGPVLAKLYKIENPMAVGTAIGVSSHAIGTARAHDLGETHGAMSGVALCVTGIITTLISIIF